MEVEGEMEVEGRAMEEREKQLFLAKLAEQAERYDEMVEYMKNIARMDVDLTSEERNLLSVGYKNMIGARRASWRLLCCLGEKEEVEGNEQNLRRIKNYKKKVEDDLSTICDDILSIIAIHLLPSATSSESVVFFYKMKGDYYRYLAEFRTGNGRKDVAEQSLKFYQVAMTHAMTDLPRTHPVRLALALNFSVLYYEVLKSPERACHMSQQAFDEAVSELEFLAEDSYKDATPILQLLKNNLTLWSADLPEEAGEHSKDTNTSMEE